MSQFWFSLAAVACVTMWGADFTMHAAEEPKPPLDAPQDPERQAVQQLLELAWSGNQNAFAAVKEQYDAQKKSVARPAEWHYAYGISLVHLKKFAPAVPAFEAAIKASDRFYFSAWKGAIWSELALKKFEPALVRIESLGRELVQEPFRGSKADRERTAIWIGQTLAAVEKLNQTPKIVKQVHATEASLTDQWNDDLKDAYQSGKDYTDTLYADLMDELKQASDAAKAQQDEAKKEKSAKLKDDAAAADAQREALKKKAEEVQKITEQRIEQLDKQLQRLERDYNYLEARSMNLLGSLSLIQNEMNTVQLARNQRNNNSNRVDDVQANYMARLAFQYSAYQLELNATSIRAAMVSERAMEGLQLRNQLLGQAQLAKAHLADQDGVLSRWKERMAQAEENLKKQESKGDSLSTRAKRAKAKTLSTYLEFDPDWERILLTERASEPEDK